MRKEEEEEMGGVVVKKKKKERGVARPFSQFGKIQVKGTALYIRWRMHSPLPKAPVNTIWVGSVAIS